MARPSKYLGKESCDILRDQMSNGYSFEACCAVLGICKDTGNDWLTRYPDFKEARAHGLALHQLFWESQAIAGLTSKDGEKFNATIWIFTMKNIHGWRDKRELTGAGGGPLLGDLSGLQVDEQISAIVGRLPPEVRALIQAQPTAPAAPKTKGKK